MTGFFWFKNAYPELDLNYARTCPIKPQETDKALPKNFYGKMLIRGFYKLCKREKSMGYNDCHHLKGNYGNNR